MRRAVAVVMALGMVVACGGDAPARELTAEEQAVVAALDAKIETESAGTDEPFTDDGERRCVAEGLVREFGLARLAALGVTADGVVDSLVLFETMTEGELDSTAAIAVDCSDLENVFVEIGGMTPGSAECFADRLIDQGTYQDLVLAGLKDEEPDDSIFVAMLDAGSDCLTPEEFAEFFGTGN
jgi:hypothetical protein